MRSSDRSRILSIDLLRGLDVWLMLFVNDMASVTGTPLFLRHYAREADGMTITDVVFPAFLFIVGLAMPFALGARLRRGEPTIRVAGHLLLRALSLLVIGVFMVNAEGPVGGLLPRPVWIIAMTIAVVLAWQAPESGAFSRARRRMRLIGWGMLIGLALLYQRDGLTGLLQLRPMWWGILGLIGWAYLVSGAIYLFARDRPAILAGAIALLYCVYMADAAGQAALFAPINAVVGVGTALGSHAAITLSGVLLGVMLLRHRESGAEPARLIAASLGYAAALAAAGLLLHTLTDVHPAFRISKIGATAPWCLLSSAWTVAAWVALYFIADVRGFRRWPRPILIAGENALLAYIVPAALLSLFDLLARALGYDAYTALGRSLATGLVRAVVFAVITVGLCGLMRARGIRLQL